jgi:hypothetical protein
MSQSNLKHRTPFLDVSSFAADEAETVEYEETLLASTDYEVNTPFRSEFRLETQENMVTPEAEEFVSFLDELYDREFDEAVFQLVNEAADLYAARFEGEFMGEAAQQMEVKRMLEEHFSPLVYEIETLLETVSEDIEQKDLDTMSEAELDAFMDQYKPNRQLSPNFENLWGWVKKKAKKAIKKGIKWAKKKAKGVAKRLLKAAMKKLKKYAKPWMEKIIKFAINKLPAKYRPIATILAKRLGLKKEVEEDESIEEEAEISSDVTGFQQEFDMLLAGFLFAESEAEQELMLAETSTAVEQETDDRLNRLDQAREHFVDGLGRLKEGESAAHLVENFIPAILPMVKLGLKFYGRPKLVKFLAKFVARLIKRWVGPKYTAPLSRAIVDLGLRLINLEATPEDEQRAAGEVVATTVEETVRRVAALPDHVLDNEELLEGYALEAFESAAAAYLPPVLPEKVYHNRPNLRESSSTKGTWLLRPSGRRKFYKKFTGMSEVEIGPHMAQEIKTWGGVPLAFFLQDRLSIPAGKAVNARVHLFEAIPGTWLSRIAKYENHVTGLGTTAKSAWSQIHPLTPAAAAVLLREPGLGRSVKPRYLVNPLNVRVGQRFYFLEIPAESAAYTAPTASPTAVGRCCSTHLIMDFPGQRLQVKLFLGEAEAQEIAVNLRSQVPLGTVLSRLKASAAAGLQSALNMGIGMYHQVSIIHGRTASAPVSADALKWVPPVVLERLTGKLTGWIEYNLYQFLKQQARDFIAAAQDPAIGITIRLEFYNPPGFSLLRRYLAGEAVAMRDLRFDESMPEARILIMPGCRR